MPTSHTLSCLVRGIVFLMFLGFQSSNAQSVLPEETALEKSKALVKEFNLPEKINPSKLVPFSPYAYSSLKFFVDPKSIVFIKDIEVRLMVVTLNESEKYQGIYLGFDCDKAVYRQYAFLDEDNWRKSENQEWRPIPSIGYNQYIAYLARASVCKGNGNVSNTYDLIDGLSGMKLPLY